MGAERCETEILCEHCVSESTVAVPTRQIRGFSAILEAMVGCCGVVVALVAVFLPTMAGGQLASGEPAKTVRLSGRLDGPDGSIPNQTLRLKASGQDDTTTTVTGKDGAFSFGAIRPSQHYQLYIVVQGFSPWVMGVQVGQEDLDLGYLALQAPRPIRLSGRIEAFSGAPIQNETVSLVGVTPEGSRATRTDQEGGFTFPGIQPDRRYELRISVSGFRPVAVEIDVGEGNMEVGNIVVQPMDPGLRTGRPIKRPNSTSSGSAYLSGRIVDLRGVPFSNSTLRFRDPRMTTSFPIEGSGTSILKTDPNGVFEFPAVSRYEYELSVVESGPPAISRPIATLEVAGGQNIDLGDVVVQVDPGRQTVVDSLGRARITGFAPAPEQGIVSQKGAKAQSVVAVFMGAGGPGHVIHADGSAVRLPREKEQVGVSSVLISDDGQAAGWLVDSDYCCTSYPIHLTLVVYRTGKPLRRFQGDGRCIFDWRFMAGGTQVAFYQDFLHGPRGQHYELRDLETGRLIDKWDGDLTKAAPVWTRGLRS